MRSKSFIAVAAALAVLLIGAAAVSAYDATRGEKIAQGIRVAGIDLGGLGPGAARARLEREYLAGLSRTIVVEHGARRWTLSAKEAKVAANIPAMVDDALRRSEQGNVLERTWRHVTGQTVDVDLQPEVTYSKDAVVRLLDRVRRSVERDPVDAEVDLEPSGPVTRASRAGLRVRASELHRQIRSAITRPDAERTFVARTAKVEPKVTSEQLADKYGTILIANRKTFRLKLYKGLKLAKTYKIAVGSEGYDTPAGEFAIQNKAVNPVWTMPDSDWVPPADRGKRVPGGVPENPLKARWLGIADGVGIHGTSERKSIGTNASHGCLRMLVEDVKELYPRVPIGTPILII